MNLEEIRCQEANLFGIEMHGEPVPCGKRGPGSKVIFHQGDGRNVYVMCAACADHNIRNRGGVELGVADPHMVDRRLNHAGMVGLMGDLTGHIGADMESQEVLECAERAMNDFAKINGGKVIRNFNRIEWEPPGL